MKRKIEPGMACQAFSPHGLYDETDELGGERVFYCTTIEYAGDVRCDVDDITYRVDSAWRVESEGETFYVDSDYLYPIPPDATDESAEDAASSERETA